MTAKLVCICGAWATGIPCTCAAGKQGYQRTAPAMTANKPAPHASVPMVADTGSTFQSGHNAKEGQS